MTFVTQNTFAAIFFCAWAQIRSWNQFVITFERIYIKTRFSCCKSGLISLEHWTVTLMEPHYFDS